VGGRRAGALTPHICCEWFVSIFTSSWYASRRLQTQLLLWTAIIVIVSVVGTLEIRVRSNVRLLEDNLKDRSETTLRSLEQVVDLATSNSGPAPIKALEPELRERVAADRTLIRLDILERRTVVSGSPRVVRICQKCWLIPSVRVPCRKSDNCETRSNS
jgi:hypothetical protein